MPWARLDDAYPSHPKAIAAGLDGMGLDAAAICYANRYGTDGIITTATLSAVAPGARNLRKVAAKLVEVGRWHAAGHECPDCPQINDGWVVHDFHDYNPTADEDQAKRQARAEAGRKGGKRSKRSPSKSQASAYPDGEASVPDEGKANAKHDPPKQNNPVPSRPVTTSPDGGDPPTNGHDPRRLAERWRDYAVDELGLQLPPAERLSERFRFVFEVMLDEVPEGDRHGNVIGFVVDYVELACGGEHKVTSGERGFLARCVAEFEPLKVFDAAVESVTWGAGTGEYADHPKAVVSYMRSVLGKEPAA